jgi:hypothetical protein
MQSIKMNNYYSKQNKTDVDVTYNVKLLENVQFTKIIFLFLSKKSILIWGQRLEI